MTEDDASNTDDSTPFLVPSQAVAVELSSLGTTSDGMPYYQVHVLHADGSRFCMYDDSPYQRAFEMAQNYAGVDLPVIDLVEFGLDLKGRGQARH